MKLKFLRSLTEGIITFAEIEIEKQIKKEK